MTQQRREAAIWATAVAIAILIIFLDRTGRFAALYIALLLLALVLRLFYLLCVRIVNEYERVVVLRMGRYLGTKGPGVIFVLPGLDRLQPIDIRTTFQEVPHETCITKDNARIDVDFLFYWRIKDPELAVLRIRGLEDSLRGLATGLLRAVIGDISLDQALAEREHINQQLREKIDEVTEQWGIEVSTVEIREILMPADVQEIMSRQMAAERTRRATVLEAEGYKEAQMLRAEGEANALKLLYETAHQVDANTLSLKYMETLQHIGEGQATKYVLPMELTGFARRVTELLGNGHEGDRPNAPLSPQGDAPSTDGGSNMSFLEILRNLTPDQLKWLLAVAERPSPTEKADTSQSMRSAADSTGPDGAREADRGGVDMADTGTDFEDAGKKRSETPTQPEEAEAPPTVS